jgi:hypothetical protein
MQTGEPIETKPAEALPISGKRPERDSGAG